MMANPQIHNAFVSLGVQQGDIYIVNEDCLEILEQILKNLIIEDRTLRTYRRAIGFGENIRKDLIPLLIHVKNSTCIENSTKIVDATVKILLNLTIPVECLLSLEQESQTDVGRHTIFELNRLLITSKEAFADSRSTKVVVDHIKYVIEKDTCLTMEQCDSINNCLLLLRNILHIPENRIPIFNSPLAHSSMQNQIIWNLFTQSIDKIMIYLMSCSQKTYWGVTMVQLIALMYKDQHVGTLQKLLSLWFEASFSESSEDNESNTSPQNQGSGESSPTITSDPTSDSSDNSSGRNGNVTDRNKTNVSIERIKSNTDDVCNRAAEVVRAQTRSKTLIGIKKGISIETDVSMNSAGSQSTDSGVCVKEEMEQSIKLDVTAKVTKKYSCLPSQSEISDCGYATQIENRGESISTSSNDDDQPMQKPVHQKPLQKIRYTNTKNKAITVLEKKKLRRKKLVKRSKTNTINMKGLIHHIPTDEDITDVLKEFTVDFLLKAYATLVKDLQSQLLTNFHLPIDKSHFFWVITYFLKFAAQLELDLELVNSVLSYDIISYLVFQAVWIYEELEIGCRLPETDLKPNIRKLHLVITAIREFLQALETYENNTHLSDEDRNYLTTLQFQIMDTEELKNLFLLLLRQYNPVLQSKQYLQDLIVTNHSYLLLLDKTSKNRSLNVNIEEHLKEFATVEIMRQYGILLEDFQEVGEYVNNCILTMMHHTAGDLGNITSLFQPNILKTFSQIWETDYQICDDWSDLIEYVIHRFINISKSNEHIYSPLRSATSVRSQNNENSLNTLLENDEWGNINGVHHKISTIIQNYSKNKDQMEPIKEILEKESFANYATLKIEIDSPNLEQEIFLNADTKMLKEHLIIDEKQELIVWLQRALIEACYAKLVLGNPDAPQFKKYLVQPVVYYNSLLNLPIPLVPWTADQFNNMKHQAFILMLHKLGFILPGDVGKIFIRIPNFWSADYLFSLAEQLGPIHSDKLKFDLHLLFNANHFLVKTNFDKEQADFMNNKKMSIQTPSILRYTPYPNSMEWFSTVLQSKITPLMDETCFKKSSKNQLSISIPEIEMKSSAMPPPELSIIHRVPEAQNIRLPESPNEMDSSVLHCIDETEHISTCETASIASDLTRMYVSEEER